MQYQPFQISVECYFRWISDDNALQVSNERQTNARSVWNLYGWLNKLSFNVCAAISHVFILIHNSSLWMQTTKVCLLPLNRYHLHT